MQIERNNKEIIIRIPANVDTDDIQELLNYTRYKELTSKFSVNQTQVDKISKKVNKGWWSKNSKRFIK